MDNFIKDSNTISKFFPICDDIYLHRELKTIHTLSHISYPNSYLLDYKNGKMGVIIDCIENGKEIEQISFNFGAIMPEEWERMGINWEISYKNLWILMKKYGFENILIVPPHIKYSSNGGYLEASFVSVCNDNTFSITFNFGHRKGETIFDDCTLETIIIR